jgi:hypothetical protein
LEEAALPAEAQAVAHRTEEATRGKQSLVDQGRPDDRLVSIVVPSAHRRGRLNSIRGEISVVDAVDQQDAGTNASSSARPPARRAAPAPGVPNDPVTALAVALPQHPDEHRPERPVLLAVDQESGEGPRRRVPPSRSRSGRPVEVGSIRKSGASRRWRSSPGPGR